MSATEEQMQLLSDANVTHVAYILIIYSVSFLLFLFVNILLHLYAVHAWPGDETNGRRDARLASRSASLAVGVPGPGILKRHPNSAGVGGSVMNGSANGKVRLPGHRATDSQQVRDAEEFELEGLISDVEDGDELRSPREVDPRNMSREAV